MFLLRHLNFALMGKSCSYFIGDKAVCVSGAVNQDFCVPFFSTHSVMTSMSLNLSAHPSVLLNIKLHLHTLLTRTLAFSFKELRINYSHSFKNLSSHLVLWCTSRSSQNQTSTQVKVTAPAILQYLYLHTQMEQLASEDPLQTYKF